MDNFAMLTPHDQLVEEVSERFIKDLWNSLWITRNSRWATADPPGPG